MLSGVVNCHIDLILGVFSSFPFMKYLFSGVELKTKQEKFKSVKKELKVTLKELEAVRQGLDHSDNVNSALKVCDSDEFTPVIFLLLSTD